MTIVVLAVCGTAWAEPPIAPAPAAAPPALNQQRILGVIPDYQTVTDPGTGVAPLTPKQKWTLFVKETLDPFNIASAVMGSGISQLGDQTPRYEGAGSYAKRFGAAYADFTTQNLFSAGVLACLLHQDPRYFRKGPQARIPARIVYSVSRIVLARNDSGATTFNAAGVFGMGLGIAASNLYYPSESRTGSVMAARVETSVIGGIIGNLTSEFWPDVRAKLFHKKAHATILAD
jgi:hypothetical protein